MRGGERDIACCALSHVPSCWTVLQSDAEARSRLATRLEHQVASLQTPLATLAEAMREG
jgi:hypothetical protein